MHISEYKSKKGFKGNLIGAKIGLALRDKTRKVQPGLKGAKTSPCGY